MEYKEISEMTQLLQQNTPFEKVKLKNKRLRKITAHVVQSVIFI